LTVGDRQLRYLLVMATAGSLLYGVQILIDIARPMVGFSQPAVGLLGTSWPATVKVTFWAVMCSWLIVLAGWGFGVVWRRRTSDPVLRHRRAATVKMLMVVVLLLPFTVPATVTIFGHLTTLLVCLPSTAFALWLVRRMQRLRRMPVALLLGVFGWGALLAYGFGGSMNLWLFDYGPVYLLSRGGDPIQMAHQLGTALFASAGIFEELGKGAGVAVAYLLFRRHFDDVVSGVVLGAAAGLGFNLAESIEYISNAAGGAADVQFWLRQTVGLMAAHTAFTAVLGAGFGVAHQLREPALRRIVIGCGYLCAAGAHFANDVLLPWLGQQVRAWFEPSDTVNVLIAQPAILLTVQAPLLVTYLLLLRRGLRGQVTMLATELPAEAATGRGAVTEPEIPILLRPRKRSRLRLAALRRYGPAVYRALGRLHAAQYDLAALRRRRIDYPTGEAAAEEDALRERIGQLRAQLRTTVTATPARPAEVPA
jgi:RsiW-degrading membrane proteinase PrsW (M82 family)